MEVQDLERVRADLATIREVAGITDVPQREDVVTSCLIGASGLLCGLWTLLAPSGWHVWGFLSAAAPVVYVARVRLRNGPERGGPPHARAEFAESLRVLLLAIPFCVWSLWALRMQIPPKLVLATGVFFTGTLMAGGLTGTGRRLEIVPYCVAFMLGALALPSTSLPPVLVVASMFAGAGFCSAVWLEWRLRSEGSHGSAD